MNIAAAFACVLSLIGASASFAQEPDAEPRSVGVVVDGYVRAALRSNLSLHSETLEVERNIAALDSARAHFLPVVALQARYTRAEGGREIDIPVGWGVKA